MEIQYTKVALKTLLEMDRPTRQRIKEGIEGIPNGDIIPWYNHIKRWSRVKNHENHAQFTRPPPLNVVVPIPLQGRENEFRLRIGIGPEKCTLQSGRLAHL